MAKKVGKVLLFTAVATAAGVGAYYLYKKKEAERMAEMDADFDDFSDVTDYDNRNYVPLSKEGDGEAPKQNILEKAKEFFEDVVEDIKDNRDAKKAASEESKQDEDAQATPAEDFTPLTEQVAEAVTEETEEFFDDDEEEDTAK